MDSRSLWTDRLTLIPFGRELVQATIRDPQLVGPLVDARVPADWPGPDLAEILPFIDDWLGEDPARAVWSRIVMHSAGRVLIGSIGCKSEPDAAGMVEIGYGIIQAYRGHGYATEAARGLIGWLVAQPGVRLVTAECLAENLPSQAVLRHLGMRRTGRDGDLLQWELDAEKP